MSNSTSVSRERRGTRHVPGTSIVVPANYRSLFDQWQRRRADFFHLLTNDKMESIRHRFMEHDNELRMVQFVYVMLQSLSGLLSQEHTLHFVEKLIDLFRQVDINDGKGPCSMHLCLEP